MKISKNNNNGFTLLELLIVVAIIGIVAAISVPNISSWTNSRIAQREIAHLTTLIDYGKKVSASKSRKLYLRQTGTSAIQLFQLKTGSDSLDAANLETTTCTFSSGNTEAVEEFPNVIAFESTLKAKHSDSGSGSGSSYPNTTSVMCFYSNGTTSGGGFELESNCYKYRIDVWMTGFYDKQVNTNISCSGADNWIEKN